MTPRRTQSVKLKLHRAVFVLLMAASTASTPFAWGQGARPPASGPAAPSDSSALSDAEVRRVDAANNRITLRHGPIPNLEMPAMTMQFQVRDPVLLQDLKEGSRIRFAAEKIGGQYVVTVVQPAP